MNPPRTVYGFERRSAVTDRAPAAAVLCFYCLDVVAPGAWKQLELRPDCWGPVCPSCWRELKSPAESGPQVRVSLERVSPG